MQYAPGNHEGPNRADKGQLGGSCNVTACQREPRPRAGSCLWAVGAAAPVSLASGPRWPDLGRFSPGS